MGKTFFKMFGSKIKVDLKYNSIEERHKKEPPQLPPEEWTEEYKKSLIIDKTLEELLAELKPYSIYFRLLDEHRDLKYSKMPKIPSHDSEFDDILID